MKTKRTTHIRQKSKRGLLNLIFGHSSIVILTLVFQFAYLFLLFFRWQYAAYAYGGSLFLGLCVSLYLLNRDLDPSARQSWTFLILVFPIVGSLLYAFITMDVGHRVVRNRLNHIERATSYQLQKEALPLTETIRKNEPELTGLAGYLDHLGYPAYTHSSVSYIAEGADFFDALCEALETAEHFIYLEFFIVDKGKIWDRILEILKRKAAQGVDVRVLYDGTCALFRLPYRYPETLEEYGIHCKMFSPLRPFVSAHYNNRDHRKIAVIDNRVAFTGGINLADEYANEKVLYGHWKDAAIMIRGEACQSLMRMFLKMWNVTELLINFEEFEFPATSCPSDESSIVIPYGDNPFRDERIGRSVYIDILNHAVSYVYIMTPYLILDEITLYALVSAAQRGVDVRILLPHRPDKKTAFALAYTHYRTLLEAGIQVFEYESGFNHAKLFVSDDRCASVGTVNLDFRSLMLHFENAVLLWKNEAVHDIRDDFLATQKHSIPITLKSLKTMPLYRKVLGFILKPFAPLM